MNIPQDLIEGNYKTESPEGDVNKIKRRPPESLLPEEVKANKLAPIDIDENFNPNNSVKKFSTTNNESKSEIPNQIDLNPDRLIPLETIENLIQEKPIRDSSTPRDKPKQEIPGQIDYSKEIIR
jgi:hypothetical protein